MHCRVLDTLERGSGSVRQTTQKCIAALQLAQHECMDQSLRSTLGQEASDIRYFLEPEVTRLTGSSDTTNMSVQVEVFVSSTPKLVTLSS